MSMLGRLAVLPLRSLPDTRVTNGVNFPGCSTFESLGFLMEVYITFNTVQIFENI